MHLNVLANGEGAQSMCLLILRAEGKIKGDVSITADTGWEFDRLWSNGKRGTAKEYFEEIIVPLCLKYGIDFRFTRSLDKNGNELPGLGEYMEAVGLSGNTKNINIPMFGSKGGRVMQRCTDKMKIRACRQEARRMGAKTALIAQGIHLGEASRRVKGIFLRSEDGFSIYQTTLERKIKQPDGSKIKVDVPIKWLNHYYPLVDLGMNRNDCQRMIVKAGIPYLLSTECDGCPHKDFPRWERTSPSVLEKLCKIEDQFKGQFFFTDRRIPLMEAIAAMRKDREENPERFESEPDFGCGNAECGV